MDQSEIDALLREMEQEDKKKKEDALTWDDVQEELNQSKTTSQVEVKPVVFEEMAKDETVKGNLDLKFILDIPLNLTVELGRTRILISELLQLGQGSVIELTKLAGEPMDIYVNNRLIARGEVVVVNEKFGVRLTDIISPTERVTKLG